MGIVRAIDLEAKVVGVVDRIRATQLVENDLIECKRDWPKDNKARQLAGSLNRAAGDPVIYIIGIDEQTGEIFDVSNTDVLDWWTQITGQFDQMPPEMMRHISVPVGNGGEHVIALAFASDRAPYVTKTGSAKPSLEVPMREGTGTRTARRDELLRILIPAASAPRATVLRSELYLEHYPEVIEVQDSSGMSTRGQAEGVNIHGSIRIYFEHDGRGLTTMPAHGMRGRVIIGDAHFPLKVRPARGLASYDGGRSLHMAAPPDDVTIEAPQAVTLDFEFPNFDLANINTFRTAPSLSYEIELNVLTAVRPLRLAVELTREDSSDTTGSLQSDYQQIIGQWKFGHPGL